MEKSGLKSFYAWYFEDSLKISSPFLDRGSKRLGKTIAPVLSLVLALIIAANVNDKPSHAIIFLIAAIILPWFIYRFIRGLFWTVDGFLKPKE